MGLTETGAGREVICGQIKGFAPPQLQDNEYRGDLTPNNPGYHHTRTIQDHMVAEYDVFILFTLSSAIILTLKYPALPRSIFHFGAKVD